MEHHSISRREFLKVAGIAGATVGAGAGLGGALSACGGATTTTTAGAVTTVGATSTTEAVTTTTAAAPATTTTAAGVEQGRAVKVGLPCPQTGPYASFAVPLDYLIGRWKEAVASGITTGDGKSHPVEIVAVDTQSDTNRAAQVAGDLIMNQKIDLMMSFGSPDTVNPVADQCESNGVPSLSMFCPWEPFYFGRGATPTKPFAWTYDANPGVGDFLATDIDMYSKVPTNKLVGLLYPNTADGQAYMDKASGIPPVLEKAGYKYVFPGFYTPGQEDFTKEITEFKKAGCEITTGSPPPPDFTNFWKQSLQQAFHPKVVNMGMALLFPQTLEAVGPSAYNVSVECAWHPKYPYKSSLTGESCQQLADDYETKTGKQWTMPVGLYALFEWAVDVLKRTTNVDDKQAILDAVTKSNLETVYGKVDFTAAPGPKRPVQNVAIGSMAGAQWVKGKGKWPFDLEIVSNALGPDLPVTAQMQPMQYGA